VSDPPLKPCTKIARTSSGAVEAVDMFLKSEW